MRLTFRLAAVAVIVVALAGGFLVYHVISTALHAEHVLHAAILTVDLLNDHVAAHDGEWPQSWADLETLPPRKWAFFAWPADSQKVQRYVEVDFSADPKHLATLSNEQFDAVRPIGPFYPFKDSAGIGELLETLREHHAVR